MKRENRKESMLCIVPFLLNDEMAYLKNPNWLSLVEVYGNIKGGYVKGIQGEVSRLTLMQETQGRGL